MAIKLAFLLQLGLVAAMSSESPSNNMECMAEPPEEPSADELNVHLIQNNLEHKRMTIANVVPREADNSSHISVKGIKEEKAGFVTQSAHSLQTAFGPESTLETHPRTNVLPMRNFEFSSYNAALLGTIAKSQDPFSIIILPDTQHYSQGILGDPEIFRNQTRWIAKQVGPEESQLNIVFVTHVGDLVETGSNLTQWDNANLSMSELRGLDGSHRVPHAVLPGNHDYDRTSSIAPSLANFVTYFGGGYGHAGDELWGNSLQRFSAGVLEFLHLSLAWDPGIAVDWAQKVLQSNPGVPVILTTHEYLFDYSSGRSAAGDWIFDQLVRTHDQIFLVLCGHHHSAPFPQKGKWHQVSTNDLGRPVIEVLQDFQDYPNGGNGWLRIATFDMAAEELRFVTYSPWLDEYQASNVQELGGWASQFDLPLKFSRLLPQTALQAQTSS